MDSVILWASPSRREAPSFLCTQQQMQRGKSHVWALRLHIHSANISSARPVRQMLVSKPSNVCAQWAYSQHRKQLLKSLPFLVSHLWPASHSSATYALWNSHWYLVCRYHVYDLSFASGHGLVNRASWALFCRSSSFSSRAREVEPIIIQLKLSQLLVLGRDSYQASYQSQN